MRKDPTTLLAIIALVLAVISLLFLAAIVLRDYGIVQ